MINPTPIKRSPAIVQFSKDHHFALLLIWKIRQGLRFGIDTTRIYKYVNYFFINFLEEHLQEEEELLFVHIEKDNDLRRTVEKDHFALRAFAEKINLQADVTTLSEFAKRLETHIRFEERELFNVLQKKIPQSDLQIICNKMESSHKKQPDDKWEDEFWIKKVYS